MRVLRLTEALRAAAKHVVAAHDSYAWDEIEESGLDVVSLDFADPASSSAGEGLIREIIACSDPAIVDDAIRGYRVLAGDFIAPLSTFLSTLCQRKQGATTSPIVPVPPESLKRLKSLSKSVNEAQKVFDELLGGFAKQRSRELWSSAASTWQKLDGILTGLDLARREAAGLRAQFVQLKIVEGIPPNWIIRPLLVGSTERIEATIKMKLDAFAAGRVVGLCPQERRVSACLRSVGRSVVNACPAPSTQPTLVSVV
jgi:hypothetical protein